VVLVKNYENELQSMTEQQNKQVSFKIHHSALSEGLRIFIIEFFINLVLKLNLKHCILHFNNYSNFSMLL
jgi:hypothetical protein